ncbi:MAG: response regulator transcription factor [Lachnospiraceae bacterium]|nr:response regulator transcription factor [Lachnospiraceae bacterium]
MILNIAVCDDDMEMLSVIFEQLHRIFEKKEIQVYIESFSEGEKLLEWHERAPFQVVFLDISMPDLDGFQAAAELKAHNKEVIIIFVTSKDDLVYESFDYQPFHFIRKEGWESLGEQFEHVVEKLIDYKKSYDKINIALPYGTVEEIAISDIVVVQSEKNYLDYELVDERTLRVRDSLNTAEERLKEYDFTRISNRTLVNLSYVGRIREKEGEVILKDGYSYSLSRNYKKSVVAAYMKYLRSRK